MVALLDFAIAAGALVAKNKYGKTLIDQPIETARALFRGDMGAAKDRIIDGLNDLSVGVLGYDAQNTQQVNAGDAVVSKSLIIGAAIKWGLRQVGMLKDAKGKIPIINREISLV